MIVRIRVSSGSTEIVQVESGACLLTDLKKAVETQCAICQEFQLSLNRTDALEGDCKSLDELGIVSGDLLYLMLSSSNKLADQLAATDTPTGSCRPTAPSFRSKLSSQSYDQLALSSHLHELQTELSAATTSFSPYQVVNRVLHSIMRDCGMTRSGEATVEELTSCNRKHSYTALLEGYTTEVTMISHKMGPERLVVHVGVKMDRLFANSYTTQFLVSRFSNCSSPEMLHQLSRAFKDRVVNRMFNDCRSALGLPESGTFSSLFPELKLRVMHHLDVKSLLALATVSRDLYSLTQDELIWKHLLTRDFGRAVAQYEESMSWKKAYVNLYTARSRVQGQAQAPFLMPKDFLPLSSPNWPPGMIGGDYDLHTHPVPPILPHAHFPGGRPLAPYRPLLPLPYPGPVPEALLNPTPPLLAGRPNMTDHTRPLLPLPGYAAAPARYSYSRGLLLPAPPLCGTTRGLITPMGPLFPPYSHPRSQPNYHSSSYRHRLGWP